MEKIFSILNKEKSFIDKTILDFLPSRATKKFLSFLAKKPSFDLSLSAIDNAINKPIWNFLKRGGKRWRPLFFLLLLEALGGKKEKFLKFAPFFELIHEGTLIVDDIEDKADLRRGKPALHRIFGEDIAINAGNFLYFFPYLFFQTIKKRFKKDVQIRFFEIYFEEMINLHLGQGTDIFWHKNKITNISINEYFQMCAFKTGCLLRMIGKMAGLFTGKDEKTIEKLGRFGEKIGIAFQIQDDILDISLDQKERKKFGKSFGNDIKEGKKTLMVIFTIEKASKKDKKRLLTILNKHTNSFQEKKAAIEIIKKYGGIDWAKEKAQIILKEAKEEILPLLKKQMAKREIENFLNFLIERKI